MKTGRFPKVFCVVFALIFVVLYGTGRFVGLQYGWKDFLFQRRSPAVKAGDPRLILLAVDEETGKKFGFPLPRAQYAVALDKLKAAGARVAAFDVLFFEPRPGDAELAAATKRFGRAIHLYSQQVDQSVGGQQIKTDMSVEPIKSATKFHGHPDISQLLDNDGHLREFQLFRDDAKDPFHPEVGSISLAAASLGAFFDLEPKEVLARYGADQRALNFRAPRLWLKHEKRDESQAGRGVKNLEEIESPYRRVSMLDLLDDQLSADQKKALKGSIVLIGSTALGYYDHYPTPFLDSAPGAEHHLNAIDNELNGDSMRDALGATTMLVSLALIALTYFLLALSPVHGAIAAVAALLGWFAFCLLQFNRGTIYEFVPPAFALVASYLVLTVHRVFTEGAEKKAIKGLFGQFVAPEVVEQLASDPSKVKLGGEKRDLTIFFLDIAHFTNISEKMDPEALIQFLNKYLSKLSHVILERRGTIDKYIGDCIMAFWNAPIANPDHRADAVLAALECQKAIAELNKTLDPSLPEVPAVRIGINSGVATVGLTGSEKKLQYTVIGDEVNLASRLEGANKFFGSKIIISEGAFEGCNGRVAARTLGRVRVVGKETPIKIYEPIADAAAVPAEWAKGLPIYERGVAAFDAKKWAEALAEFQKFAEILPEDGPGQLYLRISQEYAVIAPDASWEGVFNLTAK